MEKLILAGKTKDPAFWEAAALGNLTVQTGIRVDAEHWFSFGEIMSVAEVHLRTALAHRPLTQEDVPTLSWLTSGHEFNVREDGAIVLRDSPVAWGHLDGKGGVAWGSKEHGDAFEKAMQFLETQSGAQA